MSRLLFRLLLRLHPARFRDSFGGEMLCVFDELASERSGLSLLADGVRSLGRQWFWGFGLWKAVIALALAMLPVILVLHGVGRRQHRWMEGPRSRISGPTFPASSNRQK